MLLGINVLDAVCNLNNAYLCCTRNCMSQSVPQKEYHGEEVDNKINNNCKKDNVLINYRNA